MQCAPLPCPHKQKRTRPCCWSRPYLHNSSANNYAWCAASWLASHTGSIALRSHIAHVSWLVGWLPVGAQGGRLPRVCVLSASPVACLAARFRFTVAGPPGIFTRFHLSSRRMMCLRTWRATSRSKRRWNPTGTRFVPTRKRDALFGFQLLHYCCICRVGEIVHDGSPTYKQLATNNAR